jgi:CheY-like chemotaxis protein
VRNLDLSRLVENGRQLLQVSVSKGVLLRWHLAPGLPSVRADATQLRQILMNLVINASEAIGERSGFVNITTGLMRADRAALNTAILGPDLPEGDYVYLEVADNGCGMDAATLARIFDPFFTTKFLGRGLGLAAVLGIVRSHRGALQVTSEPGRGSTFRLLLPCATGAAEPADQDGPADIPWQGCGEVLVVDDEETVRTTTARMLELFGFTTTLAADGVAALEAFHPRPADFAFVLLDLTMPRLDGVETFDELRRVRPDIHILAMSGFNEQEVLARFNGRDLAGFIQKPFQAAELREKIRSILEPAS